MKKIITLLAVVFCLDGKGQYLQTTCPITVTPTTATLCSEAEDPVVFNATGANTYTWILNGDTAFGNTVSVYPTIPSQTYTLTVEGTIGACTSSATATLVVYTAPMVYFHTMGPDSGCIPLCVTFFNTSSPMLSYSWSFGDGSSSSLFSPTHCYTNTINPNPTVIVVVTDTNGCQGSNGEFFHVYSCVGIETFNAQNSTFQIYPNPAKDLLTIEGLSVNENSTLLITDMLGNMVKQMPFNTQHLTLNISELSVGVYNISLTNIAGVVNKRVVIVR